VEFVKTDRGMFLFQMEQKEKPLLFHILHLYPLIPAAHHRLSKTEEIPEDQKLLEEALAEQRAANRKQVQAMLESKSIFRKNEQGYSFSLKAGQMEWLLQVLNDVRVGSWLALGSPRDPAEILARLNEQTKQHYWAMEISAYFQMAIIRATAGK
jgi:hypothetical protein